MLNVTSTRICDFTETWVVTQLDIKGNISNRMKARRSKSTEQYDCKFFFRLYDASNSMVELSNSRGWDFDSTIKFNASTGEEHCEWFVRGFCGTEVTFDIKQVVWSQFPLFFSETSKLQSPASEWKQFWLTLHCCWIHWEKKDLMTYDLVDILAPSFANRQNCSHNRAANT